VPGRRPVVAALAVTAAALALLAPAAGRAAVRLVHVGDFAAPTFVTAPLGDTSRVFVVEQRGSVRLLKDGVLQPRPFLDVAGDVLAGGERGLLSLAFDRDHATTGRFWIYFTRRPGGAIAIEEWRRSAADPDVADPGSRRVLLTIPHAPQDNHNGGQLAVGPDGALYAGTGDGGGGGDPFGNGQRLAGDPAADGPNPLLGKILRVAPRGDGSYAIPPGQPIRPGARPEIFAFGVRNPWRFSFDRATGDLAVADVGQSAWEEVSLLPAAGGGGLGANLGWNLFEGTHPYGGGSPPPSGLTPPVLERSHTAGWCSITGGYVVRDPALPELAGRYVFGDFCRDELESADLATGAAAPLGLRVGDLASFGEDGCGRVYAASLAGPVHRLASSGACAGPAPFAGYLPGGAPSPAAPAAPAAPAPAADRRAPVLSVRAVRRQRALRTGRIRLRVGCDEPCRLTARATIRVRRPGAAARRRSAARSRAAARRRSAARSRAAARRPPLRSATVRRSLAARARVRVDLRVSRRVRRTLRRSLRRPGRRATALVAISVRDLAGNTRRRTVRLRIARR
jgi:hypothetical protein